MTIAFVSDAKTAARVAVGLVEAGAGLIELCGGFGHEEAALFTKAVSGRAAVGAMSFSIASITQAAAYKAKYEATALDPA